MQWRFEQPKPKDRLRKVIDMLKRLVNERRQAEVKAEGLATETEL